MLYYTSMDQKTQAKVYYESNYISFAKLAKNSQKLLGFEVTLDQLKTWSATDGGWVKSSLSDSAKAKKLSDILFDKILEEEDDLPAKDLTALANSWVQLQTKINPDNIGQSSKPLNQTVRDIVTAEMKNE